MSKALLAGFEGSNNSAKILLDKLSSKSNFDKLYLKNDFDKCASQITMYIQKAEYSLIIAFGQKPVIKSIYIEKIGYIDEQNYATTCNYEILRNHLLNKGYRVKLSDNAGNYLCNYVYGIGLRYIKQRDLITQYLFIHIPFMKNIGDINTLADAFNEYLDLCTV